MIIQKKYCIILLLSVSGASYGMDKYCEGLGLIQQDPLALYAAKRKLEIKKTTRQLNEECRTAAKIESQSNGYYKQVERRGPMKVVAPTEKQLTIPMPKL